jgi:hypothetical protein
MMHDEGTGAMNNEPLKAVSTVIELKPGHRYLLVFKGEAVSRDQVEHFTTLLQSMGIVSLGCVLRNDAALEVFEMPLESEVPHD